MAYSEFRFFSPIRDREMVRISMSNERGGEYFVMIPADDGKSYRAQRETALIMIEQAIQAGLEPGEVRAA